VYHDENGGNGWFDRGARPKYVEDEIGIDRDKHLHRIVRRTTDNILLLTKPSADCKEINCSRVEQVEVRNKYQNVSRIESTVKFESHDSVVDVLEVHSFVDVWQYLEHAFPLGYKGLRNRSANNATIRGASSRWSQVYQKDNSGYFSCVLSRVRHARYLSVYRFIGL